MDTPGVTVRPIAQLDGETGFAEVFFEDVHVADDPGPGDGRTRDGRWPWPRPAPSGGCRCAARPGTPKPGAVCSLSTADRAAADPAAAGRVADDVARAVIDAEAYKLHTYWTATKVLAGASVGPEASMNKVFWSETDLALHEAALALLGRRGRAPRRATAARALARRISLRPGRPHLRGDERDPEKRGGRAGARAAPGWP